jgi:HrpA-like RNA helicase
LKSEQDKKEYIGARSIKFFVHPGSVLFKKMPRWIMTFELLYTTKTYARMNAQVEASWIAEVGAPFLKKHYGEPHFQSKTGYVVAFERATLFGLEVVSRKKVNYEKISLSDARAIFLREGLAEENAIISSSFYHENKATLDRLREDEHKIGREDYLIDREAIYQFYDERLPASIASVAALVDFLKEKEDRFLCFTKEDASLATKEELEKIERDFPSFLRIEGADLPLRYEQACVTLTVPIEALSKLIAINFHWNSPVHLILYFSIVEEEKEIAQGRDLNALYDKLKHRLVNHFIGEKKEITAWDFGDLPDQCQVNKLIYYPALIDRQESVAIQLLETAKRAHYYHRFGLARLYLFRLGKPIADIKRKLSPAQKRQLTDFFSDCLMASALSVFLVQKEEIRTQSQFEAQLKHQAQFVLRVEQLLTLVEEIVSLYQRVQTVLKQQPVAAISTQLHSLFTQGFIKQTPYEWLKRYPIYLKAILIRLEKRSRQLAQDKQMQSEIESVQKIYLKKCAINKLTPYDEEAPLALFRWKVEELRVSYFAQILGTTEPVSKVRLLKLLEFM